MMIQNRFISDPALPWIELRRTEASHASYKAHCHAELSVGAVTRGSTVLSAHGREHSVAVGSLVIIGPDVVHSCNPQDGARSYLMAYFAADWCLLLQQELLGAAQALQLPEISVLDDPELFSQMLQLAAMLEQPGCALEKSERLTHFFATLLLKSARLSLPGPSAPPRVIADIKKRLGSSLDENLTLAQLAAAVGCNHYYLLRSFKKQVGITPHAYRLNLRIERAKELLRDGLSPAAVALETGFVDQSHFHRTFRQFVAATPRQYQLRAE
jgi:AraC-like DNA-binding protein